jgi:hypothetical protein
MKGKQPKCPFTREGQMHYDTSPQWSSMQQFEKNEIDIVQKDAGQSCVLSGVAEACSLSNNREDEAEESRVQAQVS